MNGQEATTEHNSCKADNKKTTNK